jgi:c-di-AMP phosphodiesterase-like protein
LGKQFNCRSTYIIPFKQIGIIFLISIFAGIISLPALFINNNSLISITVGILIFGVVYYLFAHKYISEFREIIEPVKMKINRYL